SPKWSTNHPITLTALYPNRKLESSSQAPQAPQRSEEPYLNWKLTCFLLMRLQVRAATLHQSKKYSRVRYEGGKAAKRDDGQALSGAPTELPGLSRVIPINSGKSLTWVFLTAMENGSPR